MLPILLALVLATGGLVGMASGADGASKYKDYKVTVVDGEGTSLVSMNNSPALTIDSGISGSFHMYVDAKGKFVIPAKSVQLTQEMHGAAEGYTSKMTIKKDVKGQVGKGGTVQAVLKDKKVAKAKVKKIKDPGVVTFTLPLETVTSASGEETVTMTQVMTFTTGQVQMIASKTKGSGLEGKTFSAFLCRGQIDRPGRERKHDAGRRWWRGEDEIGRQQDCRRWRQGSNESDDPGL